MSGAVGNIDGHAFDKNGPPRRRRSRHSKGMKGVVRKMRRSRYGRTLVTCLLVLIVAGLGATVTLKLVRNSTAAQSGAE